MTVLIAAKICLKKFTHLYFIQSHIIQKYSILYKLLIENINKIWYTNFAQINHVSEFWFFKNLLYTFLSSEFSISNMAKI